MRVRVSYSLTHFAHAFEVEITAEITLFMSNVRFLKLFHKICILDFKFNYNLPYKTPEVYLHFRINRLIDYIDRIYFFHLYFMDII